MGDICGGAILDCAGAVAVCFAAKQVTQGFSTAVLLSGLHMSLPTPFFATTRWPAYDRLGVSLSSRLALECLSLGVSLAFVYLAQACGQLMLPKTWHRNEHMWLCGLSACFLFVCNSTALAGLIEGEQVCTILKKSVIIYVGFAFPMMFMALAVTIRELVKDCSLSTLFLVQVGAQVLKYAATAFAHWIACETSIGLAECEAIIQTSEKCSQFALRLLISAYPDPLRILIASVGSSAVELALVAHKLRSLRLDTMRLHKDVVQLQETSNSCTSCRERLQHMEEKYRQQARSVSAVAIHAIAALGAEYETITAITVAQVMLQNHPVIVGLPGALTWHTAVILLFVQFVPEVIVDWQILVLMKFIGLNLDDCCPKISFGMRIVYTISGQCFFSYLLLSAFAK